MVRRGEVRGAGCFAPLFSATHSVDPKPDGGQIVAYADDIAAVAQASVTSEVSELLEKTAGFIVNWLEGIGIEFVLDKTELIIPRKRKYNTLQIRVKGHLITSRASVKYLGVHLDQKANFKIHALSVAERADKAIKSLRRIMSNVGGPKYNIQKVLAVVP